MKIRTLVSIALATAVALAPAASLGNYYRIGNIGYSMLDFEYGRSFSITGRIDSMDYAANLMIVKVRDDMLSISITPTTIVELVGQVGGISDLRAGTRVHVEGYIRNGEMTAVTISVKPEKNR